MNIFLNGESHPLENSCTISELLAQLDLAGKPVVAELNEEALTPTEQKTRPLQDGDRLELITIAAGG